MIVRDCSLVLFKVSQIKNINKSNDFILNENIAFFYFKVIALSVTCKAKLSSGIDAIESLIFKLF